MDINSIISNTSSINRQNAKPGSSELGQDQFLQLLVAQLQNQDPINPMDGAEFAAQLAQFNSVEQLISVNDNINKLAQSQDDLALGLTNTMAATLSGKHVKAHTNQIHSSGTGAEVHFNLHNSASNVAITVRDESGTAVRTEQLSNFASGDNTWQWDGRNNNGRSLPEGKYTVEIEATNGSDKVSAVAFVEGTADKIRYSNKGVELLVNGIFIPLGDVEEIGERPQ